MTPELILLQKEVAPQTAKLPDGFTALSKKALILASAQVPTDSIHPRKWSVGLDLNQGLFEYLMFLGYIPKYEKKFGSFRERTLPDIVNFQVPRILYNAGLITRFRNEHDIPVSAQEIYFARQAAQFTKPQAKLENTHGNY